MRSIAVTDLLPAVNDHQFGLGLVTIVLLRLVAVRINLPWLIHHQPMIIILINMHCSKKDNVFFQIYMHARW